MFKLKTDRKGREFRVVFVDTLQEMMMEDKRVIALEADLGGASGFTKIKKSHPQQFIQVGIMEANMVGVAAGLSMRGYIPYMHTFAPFFTRRALDQIYLEGAYANNPINMYASDPGICVGANGGTHNTFEDIAIMRAIPNIMVLAPADEVQLAWTIREVANRPGVHYIRGNRKGNMNIYAPGSTFEIGKGNIIRQGKDVLLVSMGEMLGEAYHAAIMLAEEGINVEVIDMFTLKPFDCKLIRQEIHGKKMVVTLENHNIIGGLGSAVAEVLAEEGAAVPLKRIGVTDRFGQVGTYEYLRQEFGLTADHVVNTIKAAL
jgi:Transketolase, C-terminal subunit